MTNEPLQTEAPRARWKVVGRAATGVVNLSIAGASAVGAAALHSWPVLALGAAAYAALVAWDVASPRFRQQALEPPRPSLPPVDALVDAAAREALRALGASRGELAAVLAETSVQVKVHLALTLASVDELESRSIRLIFRADELARYLGRSNPAPIRAEMARLDERARAARDPAARREYESARAAREEQLRALDDIANAHDRAAANLARIVATLGGLPAKIVRMRALDAQAMDQLSGSMHHELSRMNNELSAFEEALQALGEMKS